MKSPLVPPHIVDFLLRNPTTPELAQAYAQVPPLAYVLYCEALERTREMDCEEHKDPASDRGVAILTM